MYRFGTLLLVLLLGACASGGSNNPFEGGGGSKAQQDGSRATYTIQAYNPSFTDVTIFAVNAFGTGARVRVGRLGSTREETFEFRMSTAMREVRFELDYFSGPTCFTLPILISPGDALELLLPAEPRNELNCR